MTKMTVLHFASPFAFSMPEPVQIAQAERSDANASVTIPSAMTTEATSAAANLSLGSRAPLVDSAASTASEGAGFEASLYDTVLRRYREQDAAGDTDTAEAEQDASA